MSHTAGARSAQQTPGGHSKDQKCLLTNRGLLMQRIFSMPGKPSRSADDETGNERAENVEFIEFLDGDFPSAPKP